MKSFELNKTYRFRSADDRNSFVNLVALNRKVSAAIGGVATPFTVLELNSTGSAKSIVLSDGKIITPATLGIDVDVVISYDEIMHFEEIEITAVSEAKYDVMTATKGCSDGYFIRQTELTYDEAVEWASSYVKSDEDEYCYIIQRFAKIELQMEPTVKINKL